MLDAVVRDRARLGEQLDVKVIRSAAFQDGSTITEGKADGYVAKYATKGAESATGTLDRP